MRRLPMASRLLWKPSHRQNDIAGGLSAVAYQAFGAEPKVLLMPTMSVFFAKTEDCKTTRELNL